MSEQEVFDALTYRIEVDEDGTRRYHNTAGQLHRDGGPAVKWANGIKEWWLNGQLHRTDGPAAEYANGSKFWYINGQLHRTDGPAAEYANGSKAWWVNGQRMTVDEFNRAMKQNA